MKFKHFFIPAPANDHTPHLLQRSAMALMVTLVLMSFAVVNLQALLWQSSDWLVASVLPAVVVDLTNIERENVAAAPLHRNTFLDEAARLKAEDMLKNQYFAHTSPTGVTPWFWLEQVSYTFAHAGENLAIHFSDSDAVVAAWMNSPTHRVNIVNNKYTEIGVGTAKGKFDGRDTVFVVQLFGTPAESLAVPTSIVPLPLVLETTTSSTSEIALVSEIKTPKLATVENSDSVLKSNEGEELVAGDQIDLVLPVVKEEVVKEPVIDTNIPVPANEIEAIPDEAPVEVNEGSKREAKTSFFSNHFATSSGLMPISISSMSGATNSKPAIISSIATRPSVLLQSVYLVVGILVACLLLLSVVVGARNHRPLQVLYGVGLLLLMSVLFYVHISLTTKVVIAAIPPDNLLLKAP
jgi:Cysteine-rich secretory protein family